MSINTLTQPVLDQCLMHYDMNNIKSYAGRPVTNMINQLTESATATMDGWVSRSGVENVYIPTVGYVNSKYYEIMNKYEGYNPVPPGSSGICCPQLFYFGNTPTIGSTLHTYMILYKSSNTYTSANYMYKYEYNGAVYITEYGVHADGNRIHLGDGWYWAWGTFTTQPATTLLQNMAMFHYQYLLHAKVYVAKVFLAQGDHTAMHPKYWPDVGQTRSQTQSLIDLARGNAIDMSYMSYYNTGMPYFSGTTANTDIIVLGTGNTFFPIDQVSLEAWIKTPGLGSGQSTGGIFGITYGLVVQVLSDGNISFVVDDFLNSVMNSMQTYSSNVNTNTYRHVVCTNDGLISRIYIDGILCNTANMKWWGKTRWAYDGANIGRNNNNVWLYFNGEIPVARIYKKELTPNEVKQNYNHDKKRFGL